MDKANKKKGVSKSAKEMCDADLKRQIDPWSSEEIGDYDKLFDDFGLGRFPNNYREIIDSYLFKRPGIIVAERGFDKIIKRVKEKKPFIAMTGIASSGPLHLGHKMVIDLIKSFLTWP